jgi:beta-glucosidase
MCGGWSVFWQGSPNSSYFPHGYTIKDALIKKVNGSIDVIHDEVVDIKGNMSEEDFQRGLEKASQSDYTIVAVGEENYAEKTGDIYDLRLAVGLRRYIEALSTRVPMTKVIVILITGRPRLLEQATKYSDAVLLSFLPCEQGGEAIVDILVGDINPSGKLPITYPKSSTLQLPYFHRVNTVCQPWQECPVEWEFGYGLSYTTFDYSNLRINTSNITAEETLLVELTVKNTGLVSGKETVLLFLSQRYRMANVPERKLLKKFRKIELIPGEQQRVRFTLNAEDIGFYQPHIGYGFQRVVDKGEYEISTLQSHHADQGNKITSATIRFNVV